MTITAAPTWRPFHDEPLFSAELLHGIEQVPAAVRERMIDYLEQVARFRRAPLHVTTAFNALHFGFDLETGGYRGAVLDPELFVRLAPGTEAQPSLPVGTFVRLERGQQSLWAEVVARFGAHDAVDDDGWVPPDLSGAPATGASDNQTPVELLERVVLDAEAFGAPLTPVERAELHRLRRRGVLLDDRGHLTGPARYTDPELAELDDTTIYAHHLLTAGKPLLVGGPLGGLLTDPADDELLAVALHTALATVDALLTQAPALRRWGPYATPAERYLQRRSSRELLGGADLDELTHTVVRATRNPRFTGVWPLLAGRAEAARAADPDTADTDPLGLTAAAEVVVHANLAIAELACGAVDGLLPGGIHLRVDDLWQAGGVWRVQREPVPADVLGVDPLRPLGLGYRQSLHEATTQNDAPPQTGEPPNPTGETGGDSTPGDECGEALPAPEPDEPVVEPEPDDPVVEPEPPADPEGLYVEHLDDSVVVYTAALHESHLDDDVLPLPGDIGELLADGTLVVEVHHDGGQLLNAERVQRVERDGGRLVGIEWPLSFYPGIKVTVALARGARRLSATTTLLAEPLPYGEDYRWAADLKLLAAALGLDSPDEVSPPDDDEVQPPDAQAPDVPSRYRGIDPLRRLVIVALRRHGGEGVFGSRRLTGPQLLAALFGDDLVSRALLWQVIYTCERLVDAGKLTCEPNPARPDHPGTGGPDTFVWWPNETARQQAERQAHASRQSRLHGQVRDHWVPPFCRLLPEGYRASDQAQDAYAGYIRALRGPNADISIPAGYTFVRAHPRGGDPGPIWSPVT